MLALVRVNVYKDVIVYAGLADVYMLVHPLPIHYVIAGFLQVLNLVNQLLLAIDMSEKYMFSASSQFSGC